MSKSLVTYWYCWLFSLLYYNYYKISSLSITKVNLTKSIESGKQLLLEREQKRNNNDNNKLNDDNNYDNNNDNNNTASLSTRYLCFSYVRSDVYDLTHILKNTRYLPCDWGLIFYDISNITIKNELCNKSNYLPYQLIHCSMSSINATYLYEIRLKSYQDLENQNNKNDYNSSGSSSNNYNRSYDSNNYHNMNVKYNKFIPKNIMHIDILPYLYKYDKLITFDSDIDFKRFNFTKAMSIWDCGYDNIPPLIIQPNIYQLNNGFSSHIELSYQYWKEYTNDFHAKVLSFHTYFIEEQVPFYDTKYFEWYLINIYPLVFDIHAMYSSDWYFDVFQCHSAYLYGYHFINKKILTACALLVTKDTTVIHWNANSVDKKTFSKSYSNIKQYYKQIFDPIVNTDDNFPHGKIAYKSFTTKICN